MITPSFGLTATERVLPKLALDFTTAALDSRVTFTRTTDATHPATYVDSTGHLVAATNNQPRFDYNPTTLACKGLLIEESRTNYAPASNEFTNAWWNVVSSVSVADSSGTSPDNTNDAYKITASASGGYLGKSALTFSATGSWTLSFYAKKDVTDTFRFRLRDSTAATDLASIQFNLTSGVVSTVVAGSGTIEPAAEGFYRCTITGTVATAGNSHTIYIYPKNTTGAVSGDSILAFGFQIEAGAFATSYIPTTSAALTRNADVATMTGTNFSDWFNATEGAFSLECQLLSIPSYTAMMMQVYADASNYMAINSAGVGANPYYRVVVSGSDTVLANMAPAITTSNTKYCVAYKQDSCVASKNGTLGATDTSCNIPSSLAYLRFFDRSSGDRPMSGYLKKVNYWPKRITNNESIAFSKQ